MPGEKVSLGYRVKHWFTPLESPVFQHGVKYPEFTRGIKPRVNFLTEFTYHPWLKLVALCLAIIVWFYVRGEISRFNY